MIFAGDVAIAQGDLFRFCGFPDRIVTEPWIVNLEGPMLNEGTTRRGGLHNASNWLQSFSSFRVVGVVLANNHIQDSPNGIAETRALVETLGVKWAGAGSNSREAAEPMLVSDGDLEYGVIAAGWSAIGCRPAKVNGSGVNPLRRETLLRQVGDLRSRTGIDRVIAVLHGNYEFELYPQPSQRHLAHRLVDAGVHAVIFHHSHLASHVERYRDRTIAYGLGNWAFSSGHFLDGRVQMPNEASTQLAIEVGREHDLVHTAMFRPPNTVEYMKTETVANADCNLVAPFEGFDDRTYLAWFRRNRHKRTALPIFRHDDPRAIEQAKLRFVDARNLLLASAFRWGVKSYGSTSRSGS